MPAGLTPIDLLGFAAAFCTTGAFLPQAVRIWRTRSAGDLSIPMFVLMTTGIVLWLAYGIVLVAWPIIWANVVALAFNLFILTCVLRFRSRPTPSSP
jgi:MtN3 and saliva related transmembrane protein